MNYSKISTKTTLFMLVASLLLMQSTQAKETKKLQVILKPGSSMDFEWSRILPSNGSPTLRPAGSYVLVYGPIFKGGTVNKNQASFLVDKDGDPLMLNDSLGYLYEHNDNYRSYDFSNLAASAGVTAVASNWTLSFNEGDNNSVFAMVQYAIAGSGNLLLSGHGAVTGGSGDNDNQDKNEIKKIKVYGAPDGSILANIKFDKEIHYKD